MSKNFRLIHLSILNNSKKKSKIGTSAIKKYHHSKEKKLLFYEIHIYLKHTTVQSTINWVKKNLPGVFNPNFPHQTAADILVWAADYLKKQSELESDKTPTKRGPKALTSRGTQFESWKKMKVPHSVLVLCASIIVSQNKAGI